MLKIRVSNPIDLAVGCDQEYLTGVLPSGESALSSRPKYYLTVEGSFGGDITDWEGGAVVYRNDDGTPNQTSLAKFAATSPTTYVTGDNISKQYIEITANVKPGGFESNDTNITIIGRPVQLSAPRLNPTYTPKTKLFGYDVYPLYLVGKLMDRSQINNISIREKSGTFQKTTSPILSVTNGSNGFIDLANDEELGNLTINDNTPPTNFLSVERLSSSTVDTQNEQIIRPSITKEIFYIGENQTKEIDMTKVFGIDRNVITPDNNNIEATFITAKQIGTGSSKFVQSSLNFKEQ